MQDIIIKQVMGARGDFSHLELVQGNNVVRLALSNTEMDVQKSLYKWQNLQAAIETIKNGLTNYKLEEPK